MKVLVGVLYAIAFFLGVPLVIVATCAGFVGLYGNEWWVGLLIAPVILVEFIGAVCFAAWEDNPIPRWITRP